MTQREAKKQAKERARATGIPTVVIREPGTSRSWTTQSWFRARLDGVAWSHKLEPPTREAKR